MQHHGLSDQDVAGLHIIGANDWGLSLLRAVGNTPALDQRGWDALNAEVDDIDPDILILDPLLSLMGGVDGNNNSAAAVLMGGLVKLAAERRLAIVVAHHAAKGRDPASAESAMGAASFVNFSRIGLSVEPLAEKNAARIGVAPWEAKSFFRVTGVKQNFSGCR
jgi:RecA-family ATPase